MASDQNVESGDTLSSSTAPESQNLVSHSCKHCETIVFRGGIRHELQEQSDGWLTHTARHAGRDKDGSKSFRGIIADQNSLLSDWQAGRFCPLFQLILRQYPTVNDGEPLSEAHRILEQDLNLSFLVMGGPGATLRTMAYFRFDSAEYYRRRPWEMFPLEDTRNWLRLENRDSSNRSSDVDIGVKPPNFDVSSKRAMEAAVRWIDECSNTHISCRSEALKSMPGRLIAIESPSQVRIVDVHDNTPYVALSYCWGGDQSKLTSSTKKKYMSTNGPPMSDLSQSVRDAIKVTYNLGFRYLWVDALCIVQDDPSDLIAELGKMADIYEGAILTVMAGSAARCADGFLQVRKPCDIFRITLEDDTGNKGQVLVEETNSRQQAESQDPIYKRAWTFQEALLSPRLLYFGTQKVEWSCPAPSGDLSDGGIPSFILEPRQRYRQVRENEPIGDPVRVYVYWSSMLRDYCKRGITVPGDKLVAVSAVVQRLSEWAGRAGSFTYLAGLWKEVLPYCLLWYRDTEDDEDEDVGLGVGADATLPTQRAQAWRAPTWSWASMDGPLAFFTIGLSNSKSLGTLEGSCKLLDHRVTPLISALPFAGVSHAELQLEGRLRRIRVDASPDTLELILDPSEALQVYVQAEEQYWDDTPSRVQVLLDGVESTWILEVFPPRKDAEYDDEYTMWALVLAEHGDGSFSRIGLVNSFWGPDFEEWRASFEDRSFTFV